MSEQESEQVQQQEQEQQPEAQAEEAGPASLDTYFQVVSEGDPDAINPSDRIWVGSLTEGGHTTELTGPSQEDLEEQAKGLLAARGVEIS